MNEIASLLGELVAIDSINPDLVPGGAGEAAIARFVAHWLERAGLAVEIDEPVPGRPSVVAIARGTGGGHSLMLNAHMDTVGVAGMERPHDPVVQGSRLYGRGAFDMKGGLAAIMFAAATAKNQQLRGDVILTAVSDEEYASMGTASIVKRWHADAAIVTEPTGLEICIAHKGFIWLEIETRGIAALGSFSSPPGQWFSSCFLDFGRPGTLKLSRALHLERRTPYRSRRNSTGCRVTGTPDPRPIGSVRYRFQRSAENNPAARGI